ncbi:UDP-N-acetylmuramate dehydrogenase [Desulfonauticus submarinus]|uniref:UDP-N-acetylenolpyruvoylglucosamine reductase n=1 Tax=Desulfonauticus submarinus TaxID=206665 RepID=A0A1H0CTK5_9BACT|nr:UDP-N-acetylmuramate dehydrogenase [Desulfonauticus submarinus]SDN61213.1 UDP-N-acetylmuramate dehydrogenase [Desulfonauticus submarinus]
MRKISNPDLSQFSSIRLLSQGGNLYLLEGINDCKYLEELYKKDKKPFIVGNGTNVIFYPFVKRDIVKLVKHREIKILKENKNEVYIQVDASYHLKSLLRICLKEGWSGIEGLVGIPASLGGAVSMNAGSFGYCIGDVWTKITVWTPNGILEIKKEEVNLEYRKCDFGQRDYLILDVVMCLKKKDSLKVKEETQKWYLKKKQNQPLSYPSAGCIFKNPSFTKSAGQILDECGFKGVRKGDVCFSTKHANFLLNLGKGRAEDAIYLIKKAQEEVLKRYGFLLDLEVILLNL